MTQAAILYVEDSALIGRFLVDALAIEGIEVVLAADADAALACLDEDADRFVLALCDYQLPGTTGLELMATIRKRHPHLALVLTTGFADNEVASAATTFDGLLNKPFEIAELVALVDRHLR